jgi:uncharacterized phage protein gp47/JayE
MAQPEIKSFEQLLGEALAAYMSKIGVNDLNPNSVVVSFFGANAQMVYRSTGAILQILKDFSIDRAEGDTLKRFAVEEGVKLRPATPASDVVVIGDSSFEKKATKIYAGAPAPNIGATVLKVSNASDWPSSGSVYVGRNTPNIEGPIAYSSITPVGGYFEINLVNPTVKFHNVSESVILAQGGNRTVPGSSIVKAPSAGGAQDVEFAVNEQAVLLDGENRLEGVRVTAQQVGTSGNVPRLAIKEFAVEPFTGATVTNETAFSNARDEETDDELRARIKRARATRGLGSALAIKNATFGAQAQDGTEASSVTSNEIVTSGGITKQFVDDGTGYERKTAGVGLEFIVDSALGGETNFQLATGGRQTGVAKAFLMGSNKEPYVLSGGERLAVKIGGELSEHVFDAEDFAAAGAASAYEVVASINSNYDLTYSAATAENGTKVVIFAKAEEDEDIQAVEPTTGTNASESIGFPANEVQTLRLYRNSTPLSKNGRTAFVTSAQQSDWSSSIAAGDTLIIAIDGTDEITFTFADQDFIDSSSFPTVSSTNDLAAWVAVMNAKLTGLTASVEGQSIKLTSNLGALNRASISISPASTLVSKGMFTLAIGLEASGLESDFEFSRNTGQIKLKDPLDPGDSLTAGSSLSAARLFSSDIVGATVSFLNSGSFWVLMDDPAAIVIPTGAVSGTEISVSKPAPNAVRYTSNVSTSFAQVEPGDYVIVWSKELSASNRLEGRVNAKTNTTLDIEVTAAEYGSAVSESNVVIQGGFVVVRTDEVPQRIEVSAGTYNINTLADLLNEQLVGGEFSVEEDLRFILTTDTLTEGVGSVMMVTIDDEAAAIAFEAGDSDVTKVNHTASYESEGQLGEYPAFAHSAFTDEDYANPSTDYLGTLNSEDDLDTLGYDPNMILRPLHPYGGIDDGQPAKEQVTQVKDLNGTSIDMVDNPFFKRLRIGDRFFVAYPFDFGHQDNIIVVLDENPSEKTFTVPMYRKAKTNTTLANNSTAFNAYDVDSGPTAQFNTYFGNDFKFDNYKVLMRAKYVLDPAGTENALLFRAAVWGKSGERYNVGYIYPTTPNQGISHTVIVNKDTDIRISLKSGPAVTTGVDGTTEWDVTITPNTPVAGVDQVTYTWTGTGTNPGLGSLSGGEYVTVSPDSEFDARNTGTFRVSTETGFLPTATSFTVQRKNGEAVAQSDVATLVPGSVNFFTADPTTAAEINTYVADNLGSWITSEIMDDGGTTGAGVIELATDEEANFANGEGEGEYLRDGVNWIAATNLSGTPKFTWKRPLSYVSGTGWTFNGGEEIRLIPTTAEQIKELVNVLAVSGISTLGEVQTSRRERRLQISTSVLGSDGAVQVAGGSASSLEASVITSSYVVDDHYTRSNVAASQGTPFVSGQLTRLEAENFQEKNTNVSALTSVRVTPNYPSVGKSIIQLSNRQIDQRFFGGPRAVGLINSRTWKVERQGKLVCVSWTGTGSSPGLYKNAAFGSLVGSSMSIVEVLGTDYIDYQIVGGAGNFQEISIGDRVEFDGFSYYGNNGDFLVIGKSADSKTLRVLNPSGQTNYFTGSVTITNNANLTGDSFTLGNGSTDFTVSEGVEWAVGATAADTAQNIALAIGVLPGYSAVAVGTTVTVTKAADGSIYSLVYNNAGSSGATVVDFAGETISSMSCALSLKEGDTVEIKEPFNVLNQGTYRIIRTFNDSFYIENDRAIDEEVAVPSDPVALGGDGTTEYDFVKGEYTRLQFSNAGTEPDFSVLKPGDNLTISGASPNNGTFKVLKAQEKRKQVTDIAMIRSQDITTGDYFLYDTPSNSYYVWFNKASGGGDPAIGGRTAIPVAVGATTTAQQNAASLAAAMDAVADIGAVVLSGSTVRATNDAYGPSTDADNGNMGTGFSLNTYTPGQYTFVEYANAASSSASGVTGVTVSAERPAMNFFDYDSAVAGDKVVVNGTFLGSLNQGTHVITEVLDRETVVIDTTLTLTDPVLLDGNENALFLEEGQKYYGYKVIRMVAMEPSNESQVVLVFDTAEQADKINNSGAVTVSTLNKLSYPVISKRGLDSYRYDTGLLAEVNRIVYGDPRDSITYPGVAAAGAEIYNDPPLVRRIIVGIDVRVNTGVPFIQITEQVRSAVSALIKSNPIGKSIAISSIVATVNAIPGVRALAISSPQYDSANDVIVLQPNEKSLIIDAATDILVNQIGA